MILVLSVAFAGEADPPVQVQPATEWIGPRWTSEEDDSWQAALSDGGFVRVYRLEDEAQAHQTFAFQSRAAASAVLPVLVLEGFDEAVGDTTGMLVARRGAEVVVVRSHAGRAAEAAGAALAPVTR